VRILRIWKRIGFLLRSYHPRYNKFVNDSKVVLLTAMLGLQGKTMRQVSFVARVSPWLWVRRISRGKAL
jgi:hypothetical protein